MHDITMGGRDWDLMSFPALMLSAWGIVSLRGLLSGCMASALGRVIIPIMALHTLLWIGINADEDRALARLENLLQYANLPAHYRYWTQGYYYVNVLDQQYDRAVERFTKAVAAAPADQLLVPGTRPYSYRKFLATALALNGQPSECVELARAIYAAQSEPLLDASDLPLHQKYGESLLKLAQKADDEGDSTTALLYWRESLDPLQLMARDRRSPELLESERRAQTPRQSCAVDRRLRPKPGHVGGSGT